MGRGKERRWTCLDKSSYHADMLGLMPLQVLVILGVTQACSRLLRRAGQPGVVGEILGGILLGPSVFGLLRPTWAEALFPPASLANLHTLSQLGLIIFMFIVGMELNTEFLKRKAATALIISQASVLLPFVLGAFLACFLHAEYAPAGVPLHLFGLFLGIAMSITAFPVLARILQEKAMSGSSPGTLALACAAVDDITAWCALAMAVALARGETALKSIGTAFLAAAYVAAMVFIVKPLLRSWLDRRDPTEDSAAGAVALLVLCCCAFIAERIGIHALFGAFLAGAIMPQSLNFRQDLARRLGGFSTLVLLPIFFALTGLRTQLGLIHNAHSWLVFGLILSLAVAGKLGGSLLAGRWSGLAWRESLALGVLMNTRGLVELVVLNIGYDLGLLSSSLFTMMVLMALLTTLMTGPLLNALYPAGRPQKSFRKEAEPG